MPGNVMFKMLRHFTTNQRACFDVESADHYLFSGTSNGDLVVFDLKDEATVKIPVLTRRVAECAVPCVSLRENKPPLVALCTGERVFPRPLLSRSPSESDSDDEETYRTKRHVRELDNSLQLWSFEPCP
ncbi:hypothetical protein COOONC_15264 [Cooperia oncophora]